MTSSAVMLAELSDSIDAVAILQELCGVGEVYESGDEIIHSCKLPFGMHQNGDQSPSASLNKKTLLFNCFTCGGGSLFWLVENILDLNPNQAILKIKGYSSGIVEEYDTFLERLNGNLSKEKPENKVDIPVYSENILDQWISETEYMDSRGIDRAVQREMKIGLKECEQEWVRSGDAFQQISVSRIIIPHFFNNELVGWQGRKLTNDPRVPKYKNTKQFPKAWTLYNYDNLDKNDELIVVESPMSVLKLKSVGVNNVVSTFGASISAYQVSLMKKFQKICVWMDGDPAGRKASSYLIRNLSKTNTLSILEEENEDPASVEDPLDYLHNKRKNLLQWNLSLKGLKV